jgi:hypothetical protein
MKNILYLLTAGALLFSSSIIAQQTQQFAFYKKSNECYQSRICRG